MWRNDLQIFVSICDTSNCQSMWKENKADYCFDEDTLCWNSIQMEMTESAI